MTEEEFNVLADGWHSCIASGNDCDDNCGQMQKVRRCVEDPDYYRQRQAELSNPKAGSIGNCQRPPDVVQAWLEKFEAAVERCRRSSTVKGKKK